VPVSAAADLEARIVDTSDLPSLPDIAVRLIELTPAPSVTIHQISTCLSADPALVQKILRAANSSVYGLEGRIGTVRRAAALLGLTTLRGLVLGFSLMPEARGTDTGAFSMTTYWRAALTGAVVARSLAERVGFHEPEQAFAAGLLQDIGVLALNQAAPEAYARTLDRHRQHQSATTDGAGLTDVTDARCRIEHDVLGTDHARVGARLCRAWGLPDILTASIRFHHAEADLEDRSPRVVDLTRLLNLAAVAGRAHAVAGERPPRGALDRLGKAYFGLTHEDLDDALRRAIDEANGAAEQFGIPGKHLHHDDIQDRADRAWANLDLPTERDADQEAQQSAFIAGEHVRRRHLADLKRQFADPANRDPLSGVFNQPCLLRFLAEQIASGRAANRPVGLILVNIHRLGRINDAFGHARGDAVIAQLAHRLSSSAREGDFVARREGDEFAVALLDADLEAVRHTAVRLQTAVWDRPFLVAGGRDIAVGAGIAAVCLTDYTRVDSPKELLATADRLLFAAKRWRNRKTCVVRV